MNAINELLTGAQHPQLLKGDEFLRVLLEGTKEEYLDYKRQLQDFFEADDSAEVSSLERLQGIVYLKGRISMLFHLSDLYPEKCPATLRGRLRTLDGILHKAYQDQMRTMEEQRCRDLPVVAQWSKHGYNLVLLLKMLIQSGTIKPARNRRFVESELIQQIGRMFGENLSKNTIKNTRQYLMSRNADPEDLFRSLGSYCRTWMAC